MPIERVDFANSRGQSLAALLEPPDREPVVAAPVANMLRLLGSAPFHWRGR
jgi:hypothetical protein